MFRSIRNRIISAYSLFFVTSSAQALLEVEERLFHYMLSAQTAAAALLTAEHRQQHVWSLWWSGGSCDVNPPEVVTRPRRRQAPSESHRKTVMRLFRL